MTKHLVEQASAKPVRKVRWGGYAAAALTAITYVVSAAQGDAVVSQEAFLNALGVLSASLVPVITSWFAKADADE